MATEIPTLSSYRLAKMRERVERLERALIEAHARMHAGAGEWYTDAPGARDHYRTLAENELVREGLVRPKEVREMEPRGNGQTGG